MNTINYMVVSAIFLWSCGQLNSENDSEKINPRSADTIPVTKSSQQKDPFFNRLYFSRSDAEKILGEKAFLSDSSKTIKQDTLECKSAFTANSKDPVSGKTGVIYFMIEKYNTESAAKNAYNFIKVANENHEGIKIVQDMGDEAYFHSDGRNFYFYLVRKGKIMFRMKVNKITSHTSLDEFNRVSKKISGAL